MRNSLLGGLALGLLVACAPTAAPPPASSPGGGPSVPPEAQAVIELARQDLARERNVPVEQVKVISIEASTWSDTSLGCPKPGELYAQVITPGYRLRLDDGSAQFTYHTDTNRTVRRCS